MTFYKQYKTSPDLQPYIDCIWFENLFDRIEHRCKKQLLIPDQSVELIFTDHKIHRSIEGRKEENGLKSHLAGMKTKWQHVSLTGSSLLSIRFKPFALRHFTRLPILDTIDQHLNIETVFGPEVLELEAKLFEQTDIFQQIYLIEQFLKKCLHKHQLQPSFFDVLLDRVLKTYGQISIHELAHSFKISTKTVERYFLMHLGIPPKKFCRLVRFVYTIRLQQQCKNIALTSLAYDAFYYDQNHFIKEIKKFTGLVPKRYFTSDKGIQTSIFSESIN